MVFDAHVHIKNGKPNPSGLMELMQSCGITGGILISPSPEEGDYTNRIRTMREWTCGFDGMYPFFWINPMERDALKQISEAVKAGAAGFKIICDNFYPGDERCIDVCHGIVRAGKPVMFHSGILWDGKPSSEFCRPVNFESLLLVEGLRFSLAHIGWPWTDEMIAVYT